MGCGCKGSKYEPPEKMSTMKANTRTPAPPRVRTDTLSPDYYHSPSSKNRPAKKDG